ncbi:MAG: hypothetical protein LAQ69_31925 [Acidobacteriia bacterium]|nr:hypothetical protein [Terriglobia bacterium]
MEQITSDLIVLCEGDGDVAFFRKLTRERGINGFMVTCGKGADGRCLGESGFELYLKAVRGGAASGPTIRGIVIVIDSDADAGAAYGKIKRMLQRVPNMPVPDKPLQTRKAFGLSLGIILIPGENRKGNLDTLLLDCLAHENVEQIKQCAEEFARCAGTDVWSVGDLSKLKLRCILAGITKGNPGMLLPTVLASSECPFDFQNAALDPIGNYLQDFLRTLGN